MNIPAGQFKAKCLKLMDEVNLSGEEVIITKYGKAVAKLVPFKKLKKGGVFACMESSVTIHGDIIKPVGEKWNAEKGSF
jgi:prevent-host-death family protein